MTVVFDLRRTTTVVSSTGCVHITDANGAWTVCGLSLLDRDRVLWSENLEDRQPGCAHCVAYAVNRPVRFAFAEARA